MTEQVNQEARLPALEDFRAQLLRAARSEAGRRGRHPAVAGMWVVAGLALVTAGVGTGIATRSERGQLASNDAQDRPPGGPVVDSSARGTYYASLPELITKTETVVTGTVQQVVIGRVIADDPEYPTRYLNTIVSVDENLKGSTASGTIVVETRELAFGARNEWRTPGKRVLLFLSPSPEQPAVFILSNAGGGPNYEQSAYMVEGGDVIATTNDEVALQVAALSLDQVKRAVRGNSS